MELKNAVVIVTGSSSGVGAACALLLASKGSRVVINYSSSKAEAQSVAQQLTALGGEAIVVQGDVAIDADCRRMAKAALDKWGRIDGLINNAGKTKFVDHANLEALDAQDFIDIYSVNVIGAFQMVRACAEAMRKQGSGAVVNMSSIAGLMGNGSSVAYSASKGALNTMTKSLARALGPEIRVNAVCPGFIEGRWLKQGLGEERYENYRQQYIDTTPLHASAKPEDVAGVAVWLLEGAGLVTGETILVDSGMHLGAAPLQPKKQ
ncbi:MAG: glucose 1-dehydrogenase [Burkholderiales bacterium]